MWTLAKILRYLRMLNIFWRNVARLTKIKLLNGKVKSKSNGRPVFSYVTGPLDYATNYQVYIYATSISGVRGKLHSFLTWIFCKDSREGSSQPPVGSNSIVLFFFKCKLDLFRLNFMNLVPGLFGIRLILFM